MPACMSPAHREQPWTAQGGRPMTAPLGTAPVRLRGDRGGQPVLACQLAVSGAPWPSCSQAIVRVSWFRRLIGLCS